MDLNNGRIAIVAASMRAGGAERVALNLAEEFIARGVETDLVLIERVGPLLEQVPGSVRIFDLGAKRARQAGRAFRRYLRAERPAAVLSIAFQTNLLVLGASLRLKRRPRIIASVHSTFSSAFAPHSLLKRLLFVLATRWLYRRADKVVAVSEGAARDLRRHAGLPHELVSTIYNPVLRNDFDARASEPSARVNPDTVRIITVGRLTSAKDQATLIRAFAKVAETRTAELVIVGEGEQRDELVALVDSLGLSANVTFAGYIENPLPLVKNADLFVLSSVREGFGNALVEAMATGTPVVASDCPHGPREILEGGEWGPLVPPGDAVALAEAILKVLAGGGIDARARARHFTVRRAADQYLTLLTGRVPASGHAPSSQAFPRDVDEKA